MMADLVRQHECDRSERKRPAIVVGIALAHELSLGLRRDSSELRKPQKFDPVLPNGNGVTVDPAVEIIHGTCS